MSLEVFSSNGQFGTVCDATLACQRVPMRAGAVPVPYPLCGGLEAPCLRRGGEYLLLNLGVRRAGPGGSQPAPGVVVWLEAVAVVKAGSC